MPILPETEVERRTKHLAEMNFDKEEQLASLNIGSKRREVFTENDELSMVDVHLRDRLVSFHLRNEHSWTTVDCLSEPSGE